MYRRKSLISKIYKKVQNSKDFAFVLADFYGFNSDPDQVLRALRRLTQDKVLLRIGKGLYAKAKKSAFSDTYVPAGGLLAAGRQALQKIGVKTLSTAAERAYNAGISTQVPTGRVVGVAGRVSRKIGCNGVNLSYERV